MIRSLLSTACLAALVAACASLPTAGGLALRHGVEFEGPDSQTAFALEPTETGIDLEDAREQLSARLTLEGERLRIENERGETLGFVQPSRAKAGSFAVLEADGRTLRYELEREADGDLTLEGAGGENLYELKKRDDGYRIEEVSGALESRVKARPEKISLRNARDETFLSTRDPFSAAAAAAISLDKVEFPFAAGLAVAITHWGLGDH